MDGIRPSASHNFGLLGSLSATPQNAPPTAPPPPAQPPARNESAPSQPVASDSLAGRLSNFRASQDLPSLQNGDELRNTVQQVGLLLSRSDSVPFNFDRGAVAHLLSSPSAGGVTSLPSPPEPASRAATFQPAPAANPPGAGSPVQGLLSFLGG